MDWRHAACPAACGWRSDMISIRMWRSVNKRNERRLEVTSALAFLLAPLTERKPRGAVDSNDGPDQPSVLSIDDRVSPEEFVEPDHFVVPLVGACRPG